MQRHVVNTLGLIGVVLATAARVEGQDDYAIPRFSGELVGEASPPASPLCLWYRKPAERWVEALALGNGRLGAMVFGGIVEEHLQLNEDTVWAGGPYDPANPEAREALAAVRQLVFERRYVAAEELAQQRMLARPVREMAFQPVGSLVLKFSDRARVENYRRELDLDEALARVEYRADGVAFRREAFSSAADQVIVVRLTADKPGQIGLTATMTTPQAADVVKLDERTLALRGRSGDYQGISGKVKFDARVRVIAEGGRVAPQGDAIVASDADAATLLISIGTNFNKYNDVSGDEQQRAAKALDQAAALSYDELRERHVAAHRRLFRRVSLSIEEAASLGPAEQAGVNPAARPTDERIREFAQGGDAQLAALYVQFARYLLIASSRPGDQPATLQGLWNWQMKPPWESKYTININTEMNYWLAEAANLAECHEPLLALVDDLSHTGAQTAKVMYGAGGWVAHHNTDLWRASGPVDAAKYGMWPTGGAWLCEHLWEHYLYGGDRTFLAAHYPAMKGAAEYFVDALVEEPAHGYLVTCPSLSPEHSHPYGTTICAGPTMDMQIVRDLFTHTIAAAEALGVDAEFREKLATTRSRLAPNTIGKHGQLQEWLEDWDLEASDIRHRHVSHLYGFYPSNQITLRGTPELAAAVRKSLELRGDNATGWGLGWRLNLWARLQDAERAYGIVKLLISPARTYPNMFDAHPPFQIDGNFGGAAGILEMLVQSHAGEIELLPALPKEWPRGSATGLRARGGYDVDLAWEEGQLAKVTLRSTWGRRAKLRYGDRVIEVKLAPGESATFGAELVPTP
jgi:alpha-L-fucosidase 2